jgi:hypothetical protein
MRSEVPGANPRGGPIPAAAAVRADAAEETFAVTDASSANWVVRRVVEARRYADHVRAWAAAELRRAEQEERWLLGRYGAQLEAWARGRIVRHHGGALRRKHVALPAGSVGLRRCPPHVAIADEARALAWCRANLPQAVQVRQLLSKAELLRHVSASGEVPDGTAVVEGGERFYIK